LCDTQSGRATGKSKTATVVNAALDKIRVTAHSAYKDLLAKKENVSTEEVKYAFQGICCITLYFFTLLSIINCTKDTIFMHVKHTCFHINRN
jgi:hypothetical protein